MPNRRVTSPTHGLALGMYAFTAILGLFHLVDWGDAKALTVYFGPVGATIWAMWMMLGGATALTSALAFHKTKMSHWITLELIGLAAMAVTFTMYVSSLIAFYGITQAPTTKLMGAAIVVGCVIRFIQAVVELRRLQRLNA